MRLAVFDPVFCDTSGGRENLRSRLAFSMSRTVSQDMSSHSATSNLTYMTGFDSPAAVTEAWDTFRAHPDWIKLKAGPAYADTATEIKKIMLRPLPGSQI